MYGEQRITPFRFQNLPTIHRSEVHFYNALAKALPVALFQPEFITELANSLHPYIHTQIGWDWLGQAHLLTLEQMERFCLPPTVLIQLALLPNEHRIIVELDPRIVSMMVDRALGGSGEGIELKQQVSEVERGVFTFFVLKIIQQIQRHWGDNAQQEFRLDRIDSSFEHIRQKLKPDAIFYRKELRLSVLGQHGFLRVHIPDALLQESLRQQDPQSNPDAHIDFLRQRMHRILDAPAVASIRVGTVDLSEADLAGLEEDDIVLLRECSANRDEEGYLTGNAILQYSQKPCYGLRCAILDDSSAQFSSVQIEEILHIAEPEMFGVLDRSEYAMDDQEYASENEYASEYEENHGDEGGYGAGDNLQEMGQVLSDVPVPLVVELGRIECRARDIMHLRIGQVLELRRSPYEPLDLVVNGQTLGKGELVEIEGQLGVRIVDLHK